MLRGLRIRAELAAGSTERRSNRALTPRRQKLVFLILEIRLQGRGRESVCRQPTNTYVFFDLMLSTFSSVLQQIIIVLEMFWNFLQIHWLLAIFAISSNSGRSS